MSDSKPKPKSTDFSKLEVRKKALTVSEGIVGVTLIPGTLPLISRSEWCDGVLDGGGWAGNAGLLLGDTTLSVVWLSVFISL